MENLKPTTEDMEVRDTEMIRSPDYNFGREHEKNKEVNVDTEELTEDENPKEEIDPIPKFISENRGINKEDLKKEKPDDSRYFFDGKQILDKKDGTSLTEQTRNLTEPIQIQAHEALLKSLIENPEQAFMLLDHVEKTEEGQKTYFTVAKMDSEENVRYEIYSYEEKKEKWKEEKPVKKVEEIKTEEETLNLDIDVEKEETTEIQTLLEESLPIETEVIIEQDAEIAEVILEEQEKSTIEPETAHIDVAAEKTAQKVEKTMTLEEKIKDLLSDDESVDTEIPLPTEEKIAVVNKTPGIAQKTPIAPMENAQIKETIIEKPRGEVKIPEIKITKAETIAQKPIIQENKIIVSDEVVRTAVSLEKEIRIKGAAEITEPKSQVEIFEPEIKPVKLANTEIVSPYIEQLAVEQAREPVLIERQTLTTGAAEIELKSEINEKIVEIAIASKEIPLTLDKTKEVMQVVNEKTVPKVGEVKPSLEKIAQEEAEIILNIDKEKSLPQNQHEMLLRILGMPIKESKTENEPNLNETMRTRSIPYALQESDTSTSVKSIKSQPKTTLNGITLKRAA